ALSRDTTQPVSSGFQKILIPPLTFLILTESRAANTLTLLPLYRGASPVRPGRWRNPALHAISTKPCSRFPLPTAKSLLLAHVPPLQNGPTSAALSPVAGNAARRQYR